jgi:hypothetical protein
LATARTPLFGLAARAIALCLIARSARSDVRWGAAVFVGADGTEMRVPPSPPADRRREHRESAAVVAEERTPLLSPPPCGGARFSDARRPRSRSLSDLSPPWTPHHLQEPGLTQVSDGLHMVQRMQTARNLRIHRFLTGDEGLRDEVARRHQAGVREGQLIANACALRLARTVHHCSGQSRSSIRH